MSLLPLKRDAVPSMPAQNNSVPHRASSLVRSRWRRLIGWLALFGVSVLYVFEPRTVAHVLRRPSSSPPQAPRAPKVHLVIPMTKNSLDSMGCATLASALIHGYSPVILNWDVHGTAVTGARKNMLFAKLPAVHQYLEDMYHTMLEQDLVLLADGSDVLFQLPAEHVFQKYALINSGRALGEEYIVTAAEKGCYPNDQAECDGVPESPLPSNAYGIEVGGWRNPHNRPKWSNTGMVIGTARRMRTFYVQLRSDPEWGRFRDDQEPFNRMLANGSDAVTLDYYSRISWTGGSDFTNLNFVVVPRPLDGIRSMIPYEPHLPRLGMAAATGEIPVMLHFNLALGYQDYFDDLTKEQGMKLALEKLWWSSGEERFIDIAQARLQTGKLAIYGAGNETFPYDDICGETLDQSSLLRGTRDHK